MIDLATSVRYTGDCRKLLLELPPGSVQTCVTSPPFYGLRDYGMAGQLGAEASPAEYVANLVSVFALVRRALRDDGTLWLNLGDSYVSNPRGRSASGSTLDGTPNVRANGAQSTGRRTRCDGLKHKDLMGIPWEVAFALRADGWYLRSEIIWHKPNAMPESVTDRPTKAHEHLFLFAKSERYFYDAGATAVALASDPKRWGRHTKKDPGVSAVRPRAMFGATRGGRDGTGFGNGKTKNIRDVWTVATQPFAGAHFAVFPPKLIEPCILAGSRPGDVVLDPFFGSGTTGMVAERNGRRWVGFDLGYEDVAAARLAQASLGLSMKKAAS